MPGIEVLAVEIKQFLGDSGQTLVPKVIGRTAATAVRSATSRSNSKQFNREEFLDRMPSPDVREAANLLLKVSESRKANESKREAFVAEYAALWEEAQRTEARIFFADEAHFRADAELRGKWVLKGKPALVDSNSPRYGEKASYYSAVCRRRARWNGWNWRATATAGPRLPS